MRRRRPLAGLRAAGCAATLAAVAAGCGGSSSHSSSRPASTAPASTAPASTAPASTAPASTAPTSTAPTATAPATRPLTVTPSRVTPTSEIAFHFTAPIATGRNGKQTISYSLSVTGPAAANCTGVQEATAPEVAAGAPATITVGPAETHRQWCAGAYTARVLELARAYCTGSAPCPQYIRVVATVAQTAFRVTAG